MAAEPDTQPTSWRPNPLVVDVLLTLGASYLPFIPWGRPVGTSYNPVGSIWYAIWPSTVYVPLLYIALGLFAVLALFSLLIGIIQVTYRGKWGYLLAGIVLAALQLMTCSLLFTLIT
ncbi:MAG: hypothetical protein ACYC7E_18940 [Armatimonadota bacterium]